MSDGDEKVKRMDALYDDVESAIQKYVAEQYDGALLTQFVVVAHSISATDSHFSNYSYMGHDGPPHEKIGLMEFAIRNAWQRRRSSEGLDDE